MKIKLLQFAKLPPPIGGVTIHVKRLIYQANKKQNIDIQVLDYSREKNIFLILNKICVSNIIHIHLTNKIYRFLVTLILRLMFKKVIVTFHGKYDFENGFDRFSLKLSFASIVLNDYSHSKAKRYKTSGVYKIGAFIPPVEDEIVPLKEDILQKLKALNEKYQKVFCTNASSLAFDVFGREVYMGTELINYFQNKKEIALVFSCPNEEYFNFLKERFISFSENIFFIGEQHSFVNIISNTDALIRATTMDGDSLSVKEALFYHKQVFATCIVDRPKGVILFSDFDDFDKKYMSSASSLGGVENNSLIIMNLYESLLRQN